MSDRENVTSSNGDLVVVGSSAGGIEALSILVSTLSTDFPAPIVLAQQSLSTTYFHEISHLSAPVLKPGAL